MGKIGVALKFKYLDKKYNISSIYHHLKGYAMINKLATNKNFYLVYITPPNEKIPSSKADFSFLLNENEPIQVIADLDLNARYTHYSFYATNDLTREQILTIQPLSQREILFFVACAFLNERIDMAKELLLSTLHKDFIKSFSKVLKKKDAIIAHENIMAYLNNRAPSLTFIRPFEQTISCSKNDLFKMLKDHFAYIDITRVDDIEPEWTRNLDAFKKADQIRVRIDHKFIESFEKLSGLTYLKWIEGESTDYYTFEINLDH